MGIEEIRALSSASSNWERVIMRRSSAAMSLTYSSISMLSSVAKHMATMLSSMKFCLEHYSELICFSSPTSKASSARSLHSLTEYERSHTRIASVFTTMATRLLRWPPIVLLMGSFYLLAQIQLVTMNANMSCRSPLFAAVSL